ncbi:MAG: DUF975 family protein [Ruminococcaceae bacterium]|nr:DUF975 family protein [Oscillospiraceae bacterium]
MDQNAYQGSELYSSAPAGKKGAAYYRARAREALKPSYWVAFGASLLAGVLGGSASAGSFSSSVSFDEEDIQNLITAYREGGIDAIFTSNPLIPFLIGALVFGSLFGFCLRLFVGSPVLLGYQRFTLDIVDGKPVTLPSIFRFFSTCYGKSVWLRLIYEVIFMLLSLPLAAVSVIGVWETRHAILRVAEGQMAPADITAIMLLVSGIFLLAIVTVILQIWLQYRYAFCFMILAEYPEMGVLDAFRNSASLMRGKKWSYFCLQFSFVGWVLLAGMCTCGIGMLFLAPYMDAASAVFYDDITNRAAARETEFPSLNPDDYVVD